MTALFYGNAVYFCLKFYYSLGYIVTKETKEENRNGFSLSVVTMEK